MRLLLGRPLWSGGWGGGRLHSVLLLWSLKGLHPSALLMDTGNQCEDLSELKSILQLVLSHRRELRISRGDSQLAVENGYIIVPGDTHDAVIGVTNLFDVPIYWWVTFSNYSLVFLHLSLQETA